MKNPVRCVGAPLAASMLLGAIALIGCGTETPSGPGDPPDDGVPPENAPTQLAFLVQPGPGDRDVPLATIEVAIQDADGNTVSTTTDAVTLALADNPGGTHSCGRAAVAVNGAAYCWGTNSGGQLGDGGTDDQPMPAPVVEP